MSAAYAKCTFEYNKEQDDELSMVVGDMIEIIQDKEGGWWEVTQLRTGEQGWIPSNFVERCNAPPPPSRAYTMESGSRSSSNPMGLTRPQVADSSNADSGSLSSLHARKTSDGINQRASVLTYAPLSVFGGPPPKDFFKKKKQSLKQLRARAQFSYAADNDDELSLNVGDIVEVLKQEEEGWWEGSLNGKMGAFPSNFVDLIDEEKEIMSTENDSELDNRPRSSLKLTRGSGSSSNLAPEKVREQPDSLSVERRRAKVAYSYLAENDDELCLDPGQIIEIIGDESEGWWRGRVNGNEGVFPLNFVELLPCESEPQNSKEPHAETNTTHRLAPAPPIPSKPEPEPVALGPSMLKKRSTPSVTPKSEPEEEPVVLGQFMLKKRAPPPTAIKPDDEEPVVLGPNILKKTSRSTAPVTSARPPPPSAALKPNVDALTRPSSTGPPPPTASKPKPANPKPKPQVATHPKPAHVALKPRSSHSSVISPPASSSASADPFDLTSNGDAPTLTHTTLSRPKKAGCRKPSRPSSTVNILDLKVTNKDQSGSDTSTTTTPALTSTPVTIAKPLSSKSKPAPGRPEPPRNYDVDDSNMKRHVTDLLISVAALQKELNIEREERLKLQARVIALEGR